MGLRGMGGAARKNNTRLNGRVSGNLRGKLSNLEAPLRPEEVSGCV